jgi:hypothetical protein
MDSQPPDRSFLKSRRCLPALSLAHSPNVCTLPHHRSPASSSTIYSAPPAPSTHSSLALHPNSALNHTHLPTTTQLFLNQSCLLKVPQSREMRLPSLLSLLGLVAIGGHASNLGAPASNLTYFGAPRYSLNAITPMVDVAEAYIRSQTDGGAMAVGFAGTGKNGCSANNPCLLGACCNSDGEPAIYHPIFLH